MKSNSVKEKSKNSFLITLLKIIAMVAACVLLGLLLVLPLWKWATVSPKSYTIVILVLMALALIYILWKQAKKLGIKKFSVRLVKVLSAAGGLFLFVSQVIAGNRLIAFLSLLVCAGLFTGAVFAGKRIK